MDSSVQLLAELAFEFRQFAQQSSFNFALEERFVVVRCIARPQRNNGQ